MKYAVTTDLCKVEFIDRVFHKTDPEEELKNKGGKDGGSRKGKVIKTVIPVVCVELPNILCLSFQGIT
jgi:hypothetical protein